MSVLKTSICVPRILAASLESLTGLDLDQAWRGEDVLDHDATLGEIELPTRPTLRFHGSFPRSPRNGEKPDGDRNANIVLAAAHLGAMWSRLATVLTRLRRFAYRLGSRRPAPRYETVLD